MLSLAIVTNIPAPYRMPIFKLLEEVPQVRLNVIFCAEREPNRHWDLPPFEFGHTFLRERFITFNERYIHNNPEVIGVLRAFRPDVIVTDGFNPTHLYAFLHALRRKVPHVAMTDGTVESEQGLSALHRTLRRWIYGRSRAFISASEGGDRLFHAYGATPERCYRSCLCIDNSRFTPPLPGTEKHFDFIFCGRMEAVKNPLFALDVAAEIGQRLGRRMRILFVGSGSQESELRQTARQRTDLVEASFHGFAAQDELPDLYRAARIFLFPSQYDPWGVVANEACAAGLPVLVSPHAGVKNELVRNGENGYVCDLELELWARHSIRLLTQPALWRGFSHRSMELVQDYTFEDAAQGILDACQAALESDTRRDVPRLTVRRRARHQDDRARDTEQTHMRQFQ